MHRSVEGETAEFNEERQPEVPHKLYSSCFAGLQSPFKINLSGAFSWFFSWAYNVLLGKTAAAAGPPKECQVAL